MPDDGGLIGNRKIVDGRTFGQWKGEVDRRVARVLGIGCDDLPDVDYWEMWNDGTSPIDAAIEVLERGGIRYRYAGLVDLTSTGSLHSRSTYKVSRLSFCTHTLTSHSALIPLTHL